jgi:hypothetical protein
MDPKHTGPEPDDREPQDAEPFFFATASVPTFAERLTALAERFEEYARKTDELAAQLARHARKD